MTDSRFIERLSQLRRRRWMRVGAGAAVVALIVLLAWVVWFSSLVAVHNVKVEGQTTLTATQIIDVAEVPSKRPLIRVDTVAIEARVGTMERVEDVEVSRSWPRTIKIRVVERTAVAWATVDGKRRAVDRFGVDFQTLDKKPENLLELTVDIADAGQRQQALAGAAEVVSVISEKDPALREQIQAVSAASRDSITLDMTEGRTVVWGSSDDMDAKITVLRALLGVEAKTYDVSSPDQPTTRD